MEGGNVWRGGGIEPYDTSSRRESGVSEVSRIERIAVPTVAQPGTTGGAGNSVRVTGGAGIVNRDIPGGGLNEFELGQKMMEVSSRIRNSIQGIKNRLGQQDLGVQELKVITLDGLTAMLETVEVVMSLVGDGMQVERRKREENEDKREEREILLETKVKEGEARLEAVEVTRDRAARKESIQDMQEKIKLSNRQLKFVDIDFGRQTNSRKEIIEKTISYMREDVNLSDRKRLDILFRRTKFRVLGKGTVVRRVEDQLVHNVPVLLETRTEADKLELEDILRSVSWYAVYHWPVECVEFVKEARNVVRGMGYMEQQNYVKIRPEERDGRMQIKAEVKEKRAGARFRLAAVWQVPPADKSMWGTGPFHCKTFGGRVERE